MVVIFSGLNSNQFNSRLTSRGLTRYVARDNKIDNTLDAIDIFSIKKKIERGVYFRLINRLNLNRFDYIIDCVEKYLTPYNENHCFIINGEGAIHHDRLTSLILVAFGAILKKHNKKVILINFTIEAMSTKYLEIINQFDMVIPREKKSYNYLRPYVDNERLFCSYDFAWYYLYSKYSDYMLLWKKTSSKNKILFTKGVELEDIELYKKYDFLALDANDFSFRDGFNKLIFADSLENNETKDISKFLKTLLKYDLLISGRHHTNIVAMFLGLPIVGIKSNTHKVGATMHDMLELKYNRNIPYSDINFIDFMDQEMIEKIMNNFEQLRSKIFNVLEN